MAEPRITRDRNDIETWADEHDAVPVREGDRIRLVPETEVGDTHERLDWDEFHRNVDDEDRVVTYYGEEEGREPFEVSDRDTAIQRVASESEEYDRDQIEQRLVEGETITDTITETTVVEKTIVEQATLESEVVDRETVDRSVIDVQLVDRECQACDVAGDTADFDYMGAYGTDRFMTDDATTAAGAVEEYPFDVTVEVREDWAVTIEQRDRYTVETHITDVDVSETDEVEGRDLRADVDVESVHRQLLESDVIGVDVDTREGETIDTETYDIESEFTGDDVVTTYLTSRQRFEREISDRSRLTTEVVDSELLDREIVGEESIETNLVERDATGTESATGTATDVETTETTTTETGTAAETGTATETTGVETDAGMETADEYRVALEEGDEGKRIVDETGDEMGEVIDVNDGVAFVDPHPSLTERVMSKLGFDEDEETYRLREDKIDRITDDEIVVSSSALDGDTR